MITLAIESSTSQCSAAILRDDRVLAERAWTDSAVDHQRLFRLLPDLFRDSGVAAAEVSRYAVDVGPGRFSGLRVALATANAMAQPGRSRVVGVSAGEAIARDLLQTDAERPIVVLGDARRGSLWFVRLTPQTLRQRVPEYRSIPTEQLGDHLQAADRVATADWERLAAGIESACRATRAEPVRSAVHPSAASVASIAGIKEESGCLDPVTPASIIYIHPAVAAVQRTVQRT